MAEISEKMKKLLKREEYLKKRLADVKAELAVVVKDINDLSMAETSKATNTSTRDFYLLVDEHHLIEMLRNSGYSDEDIKALADKNNSADKEEDDEKKVF